MRINTMAEKEIGVVTHWYDKIGVAVLKLTGSIKKGDRVKVRHGDEEFEDTASSLQLNHEDVLSGKSGDDVAVKLSQKAKEGSAVYVIE